MESYGEAAYNGYKESTGGKSLISSDELPEWAELAEEVKTAWNEAAESVILATEDESPTAATETTETSESALR